jgi:hypothetical protein
MMDRLIQPQQVIGIGNAEGVMSTSLIVLIPVILLGIVGMLCFAGCALQAGGIPGTPFTKYSDLTVLSNANLMAYWPLNDQLTDQSNPAPALERQSGIPSSYVDMTTVPEIYPWPPFDNLLNPPGLPVKSADAGFGSIAFNQPGLVKGDTVQPGNDPAVITSCVVVNGCYVEAPFVPKLLADKAFTIEAWVRVGWSAGDPDAWRFVVEGRDFPGKGFALFAKTEDNSPHVYRWAGIVGNGAPDNSGFTTVTSNELTIGLGGDGMPAGPVYLALTFDGQMLTLYVDGEQQGQTQIPAPYVPNTTQPIWIGAGAPFVARRPTQAAGMPGSPLFPFVGAIQDVALYRTALPAADISTHFRNGSGNA